MVLMENDAFLTELTKLFERTRERGTVTCVMKIVKEGQNKPTPKGEKRPEPTLEEVRAPGSGYGVLVRATDGKRKVSTFVKPEKAAKFSKSYKTIQLAYVELGHGAANKTTKKKKKPLAKKTSATKAEKTTTPAASAGDGAPAAAKTSRAETGARSKKKGKK
jgi:signal recognition particle subunit SRP14|tara:strand:+ start:5477 stop:5962 length:486 start_codon:yes stop_codon:yes gene_type:complete